MWISHDKYTISGDNLGEKIFNLGYENDQTETIYRGYRLVGDKVPVPLSLILIHYCVPNSQFHLQKSQLTIKPPSVIRLCIAFVLMMPQYVELQLVRIHNSRFSLDAHRKSNVLSFWQPDSISKRQRVKKTFVNGGGK